MRGNSSAENILKSLLLYWCLLHIIITSRLPELSTRPENISPGAVYSTVQHLAPVAGRSGSFLYGEAPTNPTYESIVVDPFCLKV